VLLDAIIATPALAGNVVPLRRCICCDGVGKPLRLKRFLASDMYAAMWYYLTLDVVSCEACALQVQRLVHRVKPIYDAMRSAGIKEEIAHKAMVKALSQWR
jgi:hypothetical protein